ncbi:SDR family oxidoreductase [Microvirga makkahensis]|uniref:SDR family oxidoreductase n=1 Tax=Microvirga makkahensis TaxID=1128670 RepID=A0A7X3MS82_9HYPH|nr:SDR family oxidoreductase [Microvirga makkahensis]MXQ12267.1 SDR family oxidoreductase [Microvirga makkahensis]
MKGVLLLTGGGRGIGAAVVRAAVSRDYAVCFSYLRDEEAAGRLVAELEGAGHKVHGIRGDVADPSFPKASFDTAELTFGPVTALVNNAGITGRIGPFRHVELPTLRRTLDTNVLGTMMLAQEAIRRWGDAGTPGCMVNISSIAATLGAPNEYVHYAASKAAVEAFTTGLAKEVAASGIRINAVAPGTVYTDIHAAAGEPDRPARVVSRVPMGRIGQADEIAKAVLWLLSPEASYVTGAVLRVSGGL